MGLGAFFGGQEELKQKQEDQRLASEREAAEQARKKEAAEKAAAEFPKNKREIERKFRAITAAVNARKQKEASQQLAALKRDLEPLFRSSIADNPDVAGLRSRLGPLSLGVNSRDVVQ